MWRIDEPSLTVASRGLCGLELTLTAASKDLHSGRHGGGVANPLHAMAALDRLAARRRRPRRGGGLLRRGPRAVVRRARGDRRAAVRRAALSRAGRCAGRVRRAGLHHARASVDAAHARGQRHVGRLPGTRPEDRDPERGAREDHLPARARSGSGRGGGASGATSRGPCAAGHAPVGVARGPRLARGAHRRPTTSR